MTGGGDDKLRILQGTEFYHDNKSYLHKPESFLKNEIHYILLNFKIKTDPLVEPRRSDLSMINKKK